MALSGTLETFSLPDVLRLLASTNKTGLLALDGDRGVGRVWVRGGDIVAADSDRASGEIDGVVFDLLRFGEGSFEFDAGAEPPGVDDRPRAVHAALEAAESLLDEWREIESVVPSLDVWVRLVHEIDDEVRIDADQWRVLARIGSGADGHGIAAHLDQGEFETCRELKGLIDVGLVELDETPSDAPAPAAPDTVTVHPTDTVQPIDADTAAEDARRELPAFQPPAFAASTIGSSDWTPPERLGPDAVTEDPWGAEASDAQDDALDDQPVVEAAVDEAPVEELPETDTFATDDVDDGIDVDVPADDARGDDVVDDAPDDPDDFLTQLAHLSPKAAAAIEATASGEGHRADEGVASDDPEDQDDPTAGTDAPGEDDRENLLLRFLSSAKQ